MFCTAGERHLKLWAFNREAVHNPKKVAGNGPLVYHKAAIMGKVTVDKAKSFLSVAFSEPPLGANGVAKSDNFDLLVCGINGMIYKFRSGVCILAVTVSSGPVSCGYLCGRRFVVGAALGQIKVLDRHTLAEECYYSVHPSDVAGANARPGTGLSESGLRRPASAGVSRAGGIRPSSAGTTPRSAGGASSTHTPAMTRKARVPEAKGPNGKVNPAWGGPATGFVSEKCSQPLPPPDGVKASTNIIGLAIDTGSYSSQV